MLISLLLLQLLPIHATVNVDDVYPIEFGTTYDYKILDTYHAYGSPYGGFGRHSRETLARMPLILPDGSSSSSGNYHYSVRDQNGQLFACRLYHEDELDPASLKQSMFTAPVLRSKEDTVATTTTKPKQPQNVPIVPDVPEQQKLPALPPTTNVIRSSSTATSHDSNMGGAGTAPTVTGGSTAGATTAASDVARNLQDVTTTTTTDADPLQVEASLRALQGICGQVHKGFWSYEWCFEKEITQFHVEYDTKTNQVKVEQVTSLGNFHHRDMYLNVQELDSINEWAEESPEVARIVDSHTDGNMCGEIPRRSFAKLQCCSEKVIQRNKGLLHKEGRPLKSDILAVLDVVEDPDIKCMYNFTICTPLLCGGDDEEAKEEPVVAARLLEDLNLMDEINHDESIRQILDRTLSQLCLQSQPGGWWVYEICHKKSIRQFHETVGIRKNSAGAKVSSKVVESEHILGKYDPSTEALVKDEEEWDFVVNATASTSWGEGNGAYYQVEYIGGDSCDTADVTDSAIVAGAAGKAVLRRAASVRYYCGQSFDVQVSEDTTCHYIVEVKVPGLCRHPLFRAPVTKKRIMKCLPVDDGSSANGRSSSSVLELIASQAAGSMVLSLP